MAKPSADDLAKIQQVISSDPTLQALLKRPRPKVGDGSRGATGKALAEWAKPVMDRLGTLGAPIPHDYFINSDSKLQREGWFSRNADWIGPAIIGGLTLGTALIPSAATAFTGPLAELGATATASPIGVLAPTVAVADIGSAAGTTAATVAGTTAAAKAGKTLWDKVATPVITTGIQAGTDLLATKMKVDANQKAADTAAQAAKDALDWQKQELAKRQSDLEPTISVGNGAQVLLGNLLGIHPIASAPGPAAPPVAPPVAAPAASAAPTTPPVPTSGPPVATAAPHGTVMMTPDNRRILVPADKVQEALANGAKAA